MGRLTEGTAKGSGRLHKAAEAVKRVFSRGRGTEEEPEPAKAAPAPAAEALRTAAPAARPVRRETDISLDALNRTYTPASTSSKTSFRSDGADHHQDQDLNLTTSNDRWNDEDHFTNKSGDPRIGTRGRTYEANEDAAGTREERR